MPALHYARHEVPAPLRARFPYAWAMTSTPADRQARPDLLIPDGRGELVFALAGGYDAFDLAGGPRRSVDASAFSGLQTRSLAIRRRSPVRLLGVKLAAPTGYRLFGAPAAAAVDRALPLASLEFPALEPLAARALDDPPTGLPTLLAALDGACRHAHVGLVTVAAAERAIAAAPEPLTVTSLAAAADVSPRQLRRHFATVTGLSPKRLLDAHRFRRYYAQWLADGAPPHPTRYGYYDQAHHIHDVRRRLGTTPSGFGARVFREANEIARLSARGPEPG